MYRVGAWGTICDDGWGLKDAEVVCKQLGYAGAKNVHKKAYFGEGKGQIWLDDLACFGNETNLGQCAHNGWGSHDCTHAKDAGVVCDKGNGNDCLAFRGNGTGRERVGGGGNNTPPTYGVEDMLWEASALTTAPFLLLSFILLTIL